MTNIQKLELIGILGNVRQRLGADHEDDTSRDNIINQKSNHDLIRLHCGWVLGDESWWSTLKYKFDELETIDKEAKKESKKKSV